MRREEIALYIVSDRCGRQINGSIRDDEIWAEIKDNVEMKDNSNNNNGSHNYNKRIIGIEYSRVQMKANIFVVMKVISVSRWLKIVTWEIQKEQFYLKQLF